MSSYIKYAIFTLSGFLIAALCGLLVIYIASENYLENVTYDASFSPVFEEDRAFITHGKHIARTRGCFGCHGQQLQGKVFDDEWDWVERAVAPNLAQYAKQYDAKAMEAAVRQGIGQDGRALWSMPSYNFSLLNDRDMAALIAYLRSAPVVNNPLPSPALGWAARLRMITGKSQHMAVWSDAVPPLTLNATQEPQLARGEYIAKTSCNECHGFDLRGQSLDGLSMPDLAIVAAYSDAQFRTLMKTGTAINGRNDLILMSMIARDRFAYFTEGELSDLLAYLRKLPELPIDEQAPWRKLK